MRLKDALTNPAVREYLPDILSILALAAVVATVKLRYPARIGLMLSILVRRIRVEQRYDYLIVSFDGLPEAAWSIRIPFKTKSTTLIDHSV